MSLIHFHTCALNPSFGMLYTGFSLVDTYYIFEAHLNIFVVRIIAALQPRATFFNHAQTLYFLCCVAFLIYSWDIVANIFQSTCTHTYI